MHSEGLLLEDRLRSLGVTEGDLSAWGHAVRMCERAVDLREELGDLEGEHVTEGDRAMRLFEGAREAVCRVALMGLREGVREQVGLAVEGARDAYAHWSVALGECDGSAVCSP
jgi:hypothetical protein